MTIRVPKLPIVGKVGDHTTNVAKKKKRGEVVSVGGDGRKKREKVHLVDQRGGERDPL